jgi:hypothetical protein
VAGVTLILQRTAGGSWLSWNGHDWNAKPIALSADFDAFAHGWRWPQDVALPSGAQIAGGAYRLQAVELSANGSVLGRAASTWSVAASADIVASPRSIPANDNIGSAIAIGGESGSVSGTCVAATGDWPDSNNPAANVWWVWTAPRSGSVTFNTTGSGFATYVNVYSSSRALLGARAASLPFGVAAGQKYFISVSGVSGAVGSIKLNWAMAPASDIEGRLLDRAGKPLVGKAVYLIAGEATGPLSLAPLLYQSGVAVAVTNTYGDGSFFFTGLKPGKYFVVPFERGTSFSPLYRNFSKPTAAPPVAQLNFSAGVTDAARPMVSTVALDASQATASGAYVPGGLSGRVSDVGSGVLFAAYALVKLKDDAANLLLPPTNRSASAIYSKSARRFVPVTASTKISTDTAFFAADSAGAWSNLFSADVRGALDEKGTYQVAAFAVDKAFNTSRNPSTSTDINQPANDLFTYRNFIVRPQNLAVSRTLPISAPNGSLISYLISVTNTGDLPLAGVNVIQTLNTQKTVLQGASITPRPSAINAFGVKWSLGTIGAHQSKLLSLQVKANDNNPFGSNIKAGQLDVSSNGGTARFALDQINIESSTWLIGGALNALRGLGDAIGRGLNYVFGSSLKDQRAQADLNTIKAGAGVTRVTGADVLTFGAGGGLVASGGGNVLAFGPSNLVASGGGNLVASGGGNLVASGGGNLISIAGIRSSSILSQLLSNPVSLLDATSPFAPSLKGANLVASGGGNLVASGGGNLVASGGGNLQIGQAARFVDNSSGLLSVEGLKLISQDGGGLIATKIVSDNSAGLISQDGAGALNLSGASVLAGKGNSVISNDGSSLVASGGGNIISQDGGG